MTTKTVTIKTLYGDCPEYVTYNVQNLAHAKSIVNRIHKEKKTYTIGTYNGSKGFTKTIEG